VINKPINSAMVAPAVNVDMPIEMVSISPFSAE